MKKVEPVGLHIFNPKEKLSAIRELQKPVSRHVTSALPFPLFKIRGQKLHPKRLWSHHSSRKKGLQPRQLRAMGKVDPPSYIHSHSPSHQKTIPVERVQFPLFLSSIKQPSDSQPQVTWRKGCRDGQYEQEIHYVK